MDVVRGWNGVSHRFNLILDKILCGEGINGLKDGVTSLIDGGVGPGLGQTLEEVADVRLHGLPVGGAVNSILDGLVDSGHLVKNCLDMVLQSREIFLKHGVTVSQCFSGVFIQAGSKITDTLGVSGDVFMSIGFIID